MSVNAEFLPAGCTCDPYFRAARECSLQAEAMHGPRGINAAIVITEQWAMIDKFGCSTRLSSPVLRQQWQHSVLQVQTQTVGLGPRPRAAKRGTSECKGQVGASAYTVKVQLYKDQIETCMHKSWS